MKHIKIFETFNENKIKIGDILKRKSIDEKHWTLSLITYTTDYTRDIIIYMFASTSLDFENINFYATQSPHDINRWFINEYSLLDDNETNLLCDAINNNDDEYYFEKVEKLTKINLKEYALKITSNKYNL